MTEALAPMFAVEGVWGAFATRDGDVIERAMPDYFSDDALRRSATGATQYFRAVDAELSPLIELVIAFDGHLLVARRAERVMVLVLGSSDTNVDSLKTAANLSLRALAEVPSLAHTQPSAPRPPPPRAPAPPGANPELPPVAPMPPPGWAVQAPRSAPGSTPRPPSTPGNAPKKKHDIWG
jgi:hypothetical protein